MRLTNTWRTILLLTFGFGMDSAARAQEPCSAVLLNAVDEVRRDRSEDMRSATFYELCAMSFAEHSKRYGVEASAAYKLVGGSGSYNQSNYDSFRTSSCLTTKSSDARSSAEYYYSKTLSPDAVSAWRSCMTQQYQLSCWAESPISGRDLIIVINWTGLGNTLPRVTRSFLSEAARAQGAPGGMLLPIGTAILRGRQTVAVAYEPSKPILATLDTEVDGAAKSCTVFVGPPHAARESQMATCAEFQATRQDEVACNTNTSPGYYWLVTKKLHHYSVAGTAGRGAEPVCDQAHVGSLAMTSRFPYTQALFQPVRERWDNLATNLTAEGCNFKGAGVLVGPPRGNVCGIFEAICTKQR